MTTLDRMQAIVAALRARRFSHVDEDELQRGIAEALEAAGIAFEREAVRGRDRFDFLVGRIVVEVKVKGSRAALIEQVYRYAKRLDVDGIVIATTRSQHRGADGIFAGRPCRVVHLGAL